MVRDRSSALPLALALALAASRAADVEQQACDAAIADAKQRIQHGVGLSDATYSAIADVAWKAASIDELAELARLADSRDLFDPNLHSAHAVALARSGDLDAAAKAFDLATKGEQTLARLTRSRRHNLELIQNTSTATRELDWLATAKRDGGGWYTADDDASNDLEELAKRCDIDVRSAALTEKEFKEKYHLGGQPVLLPLDAVASVSGLWSREAMLNELGDCSVPVTRTSKVTKQQYSGARGGPSQGATLPLRDYVKQQEEQQKEHDDEDEEDPSYVFSVIQHVSPVNTCATKLYHALSLQAPLGLTKGAFVEPSSHKRIFFLGLRQSGTFFHDHSNTFNLLPYGRKRWLLLPPSGDGYEEYLTSPQESVTPQEWLRRHDADGGAKLRIPLQQCTQPAGTALFVPTGWKHAVINLAPSVGMAIEVGDTDVIQRARAVMR